MRVMSYNTLSGGLDDTDVRRYYAQMELIRAVDPDILLMQEARGFLEAGSARLFETEYRLCRRGLVARAPTTGQHTAIFLKRGIEPLSFEADAEHFHHATAIARLQVPEYEKPVTAICVHLCPYGAAVRLREASYLFNYAAADEFVILGGDFNSVSPADPEPEGLTYLPACFRARYVDTSGHADRRTLASLLQAGFVDVAVHLQQAATATVPTTAFTASEFVPFRCDYLLTTPSLIRRASRFEVLRSPTTDWASDHYPILAEFARPAPIA